MADHFGRRISSFGEILHSARQPVTSSRMSAGHRLARLLTLAGKIPWNQALSSLTPWERAVVQLLLGRDEIFLAEPIERKNSNVAGSVVIIQLESGRVRLKLNENPLPNGEIVGTIDLPVDIKAIADEAAYEDELVEMEEQARLDEWLYQQERIGALEGRVDEILDRVDHVESVLVYIGDTVWSRSDIDNTLLRTEQLRHLQGAPVSSWAIEERLLVAAFCALFLAGKSIRFEEFNGQHLSARRLSDWLRERRDKYAAALRIPLGDKKNCDGPFELAAEVGRLRAGLEEKGIYGYRRINGLTMNKTEHLGSIDELDMNSAQLPLALIELAKDLSVEISGNDAYLDAKLIAMSCLWRPNKQRESFVERFFSGIVESAVKIAGADYGMSSGPRDLSPFQLDAAEQRVIALRKDDFFCCCLPSDGVARLASSDGIATVLYAVSKRMQFNRWHFVAGNFRDVPKGRHFYYPPLMPDIAEWSDSLHGGHVHAAVRYSVRVPGPSLWRAPLRIGAIDFRGFFDVRLVRAKGPPFTLDDVAVAARHCLLVEAFWRSAAAMLESGSCVTGFRSEFYKAERWRDRYRN